MRIRRESVRTIAIGVAAVGLLVTRGGTDLMTPVGAQSVASKPVDSKKGGEENFGPYEPVRGWPQRYHDAGWTWGRSPSVEADSPNRIIRLQSGELPVLTPKVEDDHVPDEVSDCCVQGDGVPIRQAAHPELGGRGFEPHRARLRGAIVVFDKNGKLTEKWEQWDELIGSNHRLLIDRYDPTHPVWVTGGPKLHKFSGDGKKLLLTIGQDKPGKDKTHLGGVQDMALAPNGDIYVADSPGNARIVKFSKDGQYLMEWGSPGKGPGQFHNTHSVAIDAKQRIYVADRENSRIQVFDANGKFLDEWPNIWDPDYVGADEGGSIWVIDGHTSKVLQYNQEGILQSHWGTFGGKSGFLYGGHHLATDAEGNLYISEVYGGRTQKFRPRPGADPAKLIKGVLRGAFR